MVSLSYMKYIRPIEIGCLFESHILLIKLKKEVNTGEKRLFIFDIEQKNWKLAELSFTHKRRESSDNQWNEVRNDLANTLRWPTNNVRMYEWCFVLLCVVLIVVVAK